MLKDMPLSPVDEIALEITIEETDGLERKRPRFFSPVSTSFPKGRDSTQECSRKFRHITDLSQMLKERGV